MIQVVDGCQHLSLELFQYVLPIRSRLGKWLVQDFLESRVIQRPRHRKLSLRPGVIHQHVDDSIAHFPHFIRAKL